MTIYTSFDEIPRKRDALMVGRAAEHLVCADLLLSGFDAMLTEQGMAFDVVVDIAGRLLRIQVKSCGAPRNVNSQGRTPRSCYSWSVRRRGRRGSARLADGQCDLIAAVAMDIQKIAYLPVSMVGETLYLPPPGSAVEGPFKGAWRRSVDEFPFLLAVAPDPDPDDYRFGGAR